MNVKNRVYIEVCRLKWNALVGGEMSSSEKPTAAFALSLAAGILILINGAVIGAIASFLSRIVPRFIAYGPPRMEAILRLFVASRFLYVFAIPGIVLGIIVIAAAVLLYQNPAQNTLWGIIILVLSILSIFIGGGFIIGLVLGIIGGVLALSWRPVTISTPTVRQAQPTPTSA
jgi:hypothetical protein